MTVARRSGFESRSLLGLQNPVSISRNITPQHGGVAFHHGGDHVPTGVHSTCRDVWRSWQRYHMGRNFRPPSNGHGWVDIAYTLGVCQHGVVLAGRGARVRTAANGTSAGNQNYYAVTWVGGRRQTPSQAAHEALAWAVLSLRRDGAGDRVVGHSDLRATACPHPHLIDLARSLDRRSIQEHDEMTPAQEAKLDALARDVEWIKRALGPHRYDYGASVPDTQLTVGQDLLVIRRQTNK